MTSVQWICCLDQISSVYFSKLQRFTWDSFCLWKEETEIRIDAILTWTLFHHRRCHSSHHLLFVIHLFSYYFHRMVSSPYLFPQPSKMQRIFLEIIGNVKSVRNFRKIKLTLSFSSNFKPLKRDSIFDNGLSLLVGDPPRTYSTILNPRPPESRGLQATKKKYE